MFEIFCQQKISKFRSEKILLRSKISLQVDFPPLFSSQLSYSVFDNPRMR